MSAQPARTSVPTGAPMPAGSTMAKSPLKVTRTVAFSTFSPPAWRRWNPCTAGQGGLRSVQQPVFPQAGCGHIDESADLGRSGSPFRMKDMDGHWRLFIVTENDLQLSCKQGRADLVMQGSGQSPAGTGKRYRRLIGIALQHGIYCHAMIIRKAPFRRGPGACGGRDAMVLEICLLYTSPSPRD